MSKIRLIDEIWERISQLSLTQESDITCLKITSEGLKELIEDYREEFYDSEAGIDEVQEYMGLEIVVSTGAWASKRFELLKSVEY